MFSLGENSHQKTSKFMTLILRIIFLLTSLAAKLPNASASPIYNTKGGIHRRNDPSDAAVDQQWADEISIRSEDLDDFFFHLVSDAQQSDVPFNAPSEIKLPHWLDLENPFEYYDDESMQFPLNPTRYKLDDYFSSLESDAQPAHAINHQSNAPLPATKLHADPQHYEQSDDESIEYPHHRKRRRISPDSEETAGLKTTGLDFTELPDASVDDNVDDESAIQIKRRGKY